MTTTLIVLAHPDPRSFNGSWADATRSACENLGDTVFFSDLVAMGFDPVERAVHYPFQHSDTPFDVLKAQEKAADLSCLPSDVRLEIEKLAEFSIQVTFARPQHSSVREIVFIG